jgi:Xaa-Pro aminopeptidase
MREHGVDAYLIPTADAHLNEYVPTCWQRRNWLSGFTGSAGDLLVLPNQAALWTDGRYFLQAEQELEGSGIELYRSGEPGVPTIEEHLCSVLKKGKKVGIDPRVLSMARAKAMREKLSKAGVILAFVDTNLVDSIWDGAPCMPRAPIEIVPLQRAGESTESKLNELRSAMRKKGADALVITTLDAVAWTFNIRGKDVDYNPVVIAYGLITLEEATLYVDPSKVGKAMAEKLQGMTICPYEQMGAALESLAKRKACVWVDQDNTNQWVAEQLGPCSLVTDASPIIERKARKNPLEIAGMRRAHLRDGVAMVKFLRWLSEQVPKGNVTELSAERQLEVFRSQGRHYRGPSFRTIAGFGPHGAIVHYAATEQSNAKLRSGIFLIDSGGQYLDGTTDITRTVQLGSKATAEHRRVFTLVLKGHIALARAKFPTGVRGMRLDTLARLPLWMDGRDYNHGTGHGVGAYLSVHEGPQSISPVRCQGAVLEPGNILSNEPGYYAAGKFGVRIENLVLVVKDPKLSTSEKTWLMFETLTLCPIDRTLLDMSLLTPEEIAWLNEYHRRVESTISPLLDDDRDRRWLEKACAPISKD